MGKSQSALEYLMTYGWAILIIVIVAAVLYSFGIFSPSSVPSTVTGFSGLGSITAQCYSGGLLRISFGNSIGKMINITNITVTDITTGQVSSFSGNSTLDPNPEIFSDGAYVFSIKHICPSSGSKYSLRVNVNYTIPGSTFSGPYETSGAASGTVSSTSSPVSVAEFNGAFTTYGTSNPQLSGINANWVANQNYSISVWINFNSVSGDQANQCFIYITNGGTMCPLGLLSGQILGSVWQLTDVVDSNNVASGSWYNIILSYNKTTGTNVLYVNGVEIGTTTGTISFPGQGASEVLTLGYPTSAPSCIFSSSCTPAPGMSTISGEVSNFQFYDSALTATEVSTIYSEGLLGKPVSGAAMVLWWPLNGTAKDYGGNNNVGTINNVFFTSNYVLP